MDLKSHFLKDRYAAHSGIDLLEVAPGRAITRMTIAEIHLNSVGTAHGGAMFTLADFAFAAASNSHGQVALGITTSMQYLKAIPGTGAVLTAEAEETSRSRRIATYTVRVTDDTGDLVALFTGTVFRKKDPFPPDANETLD